MSVPAAWRPRLTREDFSGIIAQTGIPEKAVEAYPRDYLEIIQTKLDQNDPLLEETEFESTILFGGTMLPFDKEGRINLPENYKHDAEIVTYVQLANSDPSLLREIVVEKAGLRLANPDSWPEQARQLDGSTP